MPANPREPASPVKRSTYRCEPSKLVRISLRRPPAFTLVAGNFVRIKDACTAVRQSVIRSLVVPGGAGIQLNEAIESEIICAAAFFPDPPAIVRPTAPIAVSIAEQKQLGWTLDAAGTTEIVFVARAAKRRGRAATLPMHVHRADAAGDFDFIEFELSHDRVCPLCVTVFLLGRAVVDLRIFSNVSEQVRTPTRLDAFAR